LRRFDRQEVTMDQITSFDSLGVGVPPHILSLREQSDLITELVRGRLDKILPAAMDDADLDMWIVMCQEDNPDPLFETMIPFDNWRPILSCLVFAREGRTIRRYNLSGCDS
jgi:hypothetical protein